MSNIHQEISPLPERFPDPVIPADQLVWTEAEQALIQEYIAAYPEADAAVMRVLWMAQEKFGFLPPEAIQLVADRIGVSYAKAYGVATFYTMYFKEKKGKFVLDVCTCFSCQVCGGYDMLHYLEKKLGVHAGETTEDGLFTVQEAECLGACGSAPMLQVTNGEYVHNLTISKIDTMIDALKAGEALPFESVTLPQDEDELGGNRRTDVTATEVYKAPPVAEHLG
jgi:NADH-quinone oxidoreductase subunit E